MSLFGFNKYLTLKVPPADKAPQQPSDAAPAKEAAPAWKKCAKCSQTLYPDQLKENLYVCWNCGAHQAMSAVKRIELLTDEGSFQELDAGLTSTDPLKFFDSKSYAERLQESTAKSHMNEAVIGGLATLGGHRFGIGAMDFRFMGASMGSAVGEKIARLIERCTAEKIPAVMVAASGGARMQEGILSLMQMPKTCAALERHREQNLPYIAILTNPTYGGVTASFATVADVILAEPGAMIGFAGPRVIQETTNSKLPEGFQTAEFLLEKGLIDRIVERKNLRHELTLLLEYFR